MATPATSGTQVPTVAPEAQRADNASGVPSASSEVQIAMTRARAQQDALERANDLAKLDR